MTKHACRIALAILAATFSTTWANRPAFGDGPTDNSAGNSAMASASPSDSLASNNTDVKSIAVSTTGGDASSGASGSHPTPSAPTGSRIEGGQVNGHWREGTRLIDQVGQFRAAGDRLSFTSSDGALHFDCLENLCGQRVARAVTDSPEPLAWTITGELTEFRGTNYLLLSQAVLKPRPRRAVHAP